MTAIRKRAREFIAVLVLVVIAVVVGGYILNQQRLTLPGWVPVVGKNFFELKAQFSTAQAVTPGQGQTVNIAGVDVGEITKVELVDGRAIVSMDIEEDHGTVYPNAQLLLRPKTGLKDMVVQMDPGDRSAGPKLKDGATLPVSNSLPDVNPDEVLAALDADTRQYLKLLLGGAGEGLKDRQADLSQTLRRFEPTARDIELITSELKERRQSIRRSVHNFQLLATTLGDSDQELGDLVDSSNAVFAAFANQEARIREVLQELPPTLQVTQTNLQRVDQLAGLLGPTLQDLRPAARALGPALQATRPFLRETTPVIRDQLRPFTVTARPPVRALRPVAENLADITPELSSVFDTLNYTLNTLAYNPPGERDEGYLFWLAWANHTATTVFQNQDAHGPIRRGLVMLSCQGAGIIAQVAAVNPALKTLVDLTNIPTQAEVCPEQAGAGAGTSSGALAQPGAESESGQPGAESETGAAVPSPELPSTPGSP